MKQPQPSRRPIRLSHSEFAPTQARRDTVAEGDQTLHEWDRKDAFVKRLAGRRSPLWPSDTTSSLWLEAHNGLSARLASACSAVALDGRPLAYDAIWVSSLTTSAAACLPDAELHLVDRRLDVVMQIIEASERPVVVDGDTGGELAAFEYLVRRLTYLGAAAVCIEDKQSPKRNSFDSSVPLLEQPERFAEKIRAGITLRGANGPQLIARIESLVARQPMADAVGRARCYADAGADALLIHSTWNSDEYFQFANQIKQPSAGRASELPLICVPTAYPGLPRRQLFEAGYNTIIYANHMLRASMSVMQSVAQNLLISGELKDQPLIGVKELIKFLDDSRPSHLSTK